jgi:hypothetical protein
MNGGTNPNILVADHHQPATPTTYEHSSTAGPSNGTIVMLVLSLCYGSLICAENSATFPQFLLRKNIILWNMNQILLKLHITNNIVLKHQFMHNHSLLQAQMVKLIWSYHPLKISEHYVLNFIISFIVVSPKQQNYLGEASSSHVSISLSSEALLKHKSNSHSFS